MANRQFGADCQHLVTILHPLMAVIGILEAHSATLADCYQQLLTLAAAIDSVVVGPSGFGGLLHSAVDGQILTTAFTPLHISCTLVCVVKG